jgi:IS5 family transposase
VTNREGLVLAAKAFAGNPYDGHTLAETLDQATSVSGVTPERIYVDKGYRGHNYTGAGEVMIAGRRRGLSATMRRELRRRSAIEATIGHMKTDGRLDRNFLLGQAGDAINALLAAAGHNLRLVLAALALWLAFILAAIAKAIANANTAVCSLPAKPSMT